MNPTSSILSTGLFLLASLFAHAANPIPFVNQPLVPSSVVPGSPGFNLTVNGSAFVNGAVVNWNGSPRTTTFVSGTRLQASVLATDIASASTASVTVTNPGGGTSNAGYFAVAAPSSTVFMSERTQLTQSGGSPVVADFNRDGIMDIAVPNGYTQQIDVVLGNGDGTFQAPRSFPTSSYVVSLLAGDFNHDGIPDLVVEVGTPELSVFLGNGDGTFRDVQDMTSTEYLTSFVAGDFNRDGALDVVAENGNGSLSILLGNGDGTLQTPSDFAPGSNPLCATGGDFNGDGKLDLAIGIDGTDLVGILLGNGDGTFQAVQKFSVIDSDAYGIVAADFNGDGKLDLATANVNGSSATVLIGSGDGTFGSPRKYALSSNAYGLTVGDFNADGALDLAVGTGATDFYGFNDIAILEGKGDGTFGSPLQFSGGNFGGQPQPLVIADFNGDGKLDFVDPLVVDIQDAQAVMTLTPSSIKFPLTLVNTLSKPVPVQITNTGANPVSLSSIVVTTNNPLSNTQMFAELNHCPGQLGPSASCTANVYFAPVQKGSATGFMGVFDDGGNSPQLVSVSGKATVVVLSPRSLDFGNQAVGTSSPAKRVVVTNTGSTTLNITLIGFGGANPGDFAQVNACGAKLKPGLRCEIEVVFTPTATGPRSAILGIEDNGGASPQRVNITGTGT